MRKSNWIMKPQFSGWNFQKYLSCHHLVQECVLNMLKILTPLECLFWFNGISTTFCRLELVSKSISCTHPQKQGKLWQSLPWVISTPNHQKKGRYGCFTDICHLHGKCQVDLGLWSGLLHQFSQRDEWGMKISNPNRGEENPGTSLSLEYCTSGEPADRLIGCISGVPQLPHCEPPKQASSDGCHGPSRSCLRRKTDAEKSHDNAYALRVCLSDAYQKCNFEHAAEKKTGAAWNKKLQKINKLLRLPSRELTYPTLGKGKSSLKLAFQGICLFPGGYYLTVNMWDLRHPTNICHWKKITGRKTFNSCIGWLHPTRKTRENLQNSIYIYIYIYIYLVPVHGGFLKWWYH